jgi:ribosomal protein S18 acetylase RimI-like enzyme
MHIRPYQPEDFVAIKEITVEAFDGVSIDQAIEREFGLINGNNWQWRKGRHIDADVARESEGIFVVEIDGRIVGSISTWQDKDAGIGHIPNITFVPELRGKGLGRKLIEFALEHFRKSGLTHVRIETLAHNEVGDHLYRSLGFREVASQIHFAADLNDCKTASENRSENSDSSQSEPGR